MLTPLLQWVYTRSKCSCQIGTIYQYVLLFLSFFLLNKQQILIVALSSFLMDMNSFRDDYFWLKYSHLKIVCTLQTNTVQHELFKR